MAYPYPTAFDGTRPGEVNTDLGVPHPSLFQLAPRFFRLSVWTHEVPRFVSYLKNNAWAKLTGRTMAHHPIVFFASNIHERHFYDSSTLLEKSKLTNRYHSLMGKHWTKNRMMRRLTQMKITKKGSINYFYLKSAWWSSDVAIYSNHLLVSFWTVEIPFFSHVVQQR